MRETIALLSLNEDLNLTPNRPVPNRESSMDTQMAQNAMNPNPTEAASGGIESNGKAKELINKMRAMALDGVRELADHSDSEEYQFFKKVWDMADKAQDPKRKAETESAPKTV